MKQKTKKSNDSSGLAVLACLFIGMGFGFLFNELVAGLFLGLGVGFLLMVILTLLKKQK